MESSVLCKVKKTIKDNIIYHALTISIYIRCSVLFISIFALIPPTKGSMLSSIFKAPVRMMMVIRITFPLWFLYGRAFGSS